jgi:hypothetical protein
MTDQSDGGQREQRSGVSRVDPGTEKAHMAEVIERAATWKRLAALYLDFCTVFYGGGYLILLASRETSGRGFHFDGAFALAYAALIILYFVVGRRYAGGTLWDKIFRIGRPQPDDVEIPLKTSDQSVAVRAGFLRRLFALSIDSIIISGLCQLVVASLFVATSGQIQMHGDFTYTNCTTLDKIPDGLTPAPPAGSNLARECNMFFIGAQTAKILQVGHSTKEGTIAKTGSQNYMIDRDSHPNNGVSVDWLAMLALIVYLIVMETRTGATLGSRAMRIRVIDVAAPAEPLSTTTTTRRASSCAKPISAAPTPTTRSSKRVLQFRTGLMRLRTKSLA